MDAVLLARLQFALTIGFHFLFPPLTIGLAWLIVWIMTKYKNTGDKLYRDMARFWTKVFAVSFALGVATGITMEFQFGTNWSEYSRFVGDIFGAPLAAEGIFAFFLESSFLGVLLLGWNRVSVRVHWFSALMVALGSTLSAFWIIVANSWQQTPAGYHMVGDRAELTNFFEAVFNPSTIPRYLHTVDGCLMTGSLFMLGIGAYFVNRRMYPRFARESVRMGLTMAFIASVLQLPLGHFHAVQVAETQPVKLAAIEGLFETQKGAPALLFGIPDQEQEKVHAAIRIPGMLSLMAFGSFDAEVLGLKDVPRDEWPPIALTFWTFHLMVVMGMFFIAFTGVGMAMLYLRTLFDEGLLAKLVLWTAPFVIPLPFICNQFGWVTAEVGRQPWIVHGLLKTEDAVSVTVGAWEIMVSILLLVAIYTLLLLVWLSLLRRIIRQGPAEQSSAPVEGEAA